ncbi:MAG TPA: arginase family protein [Candidatus Heimdallarchaeota archaeon]|nr:arginase family protein [Candidatus Heimdallarchaeota archaeon]
MKATGHEATKIREVTPHIAPATEEGHRLAGLRIRDYGDVAIDLNWERYFGTVQAQATQALQHPLAVFLGGNHSVAVLLIEAFNERITGQSGVIHIDAHLDLVDTFQGHRWPPACTARRVLEQSNVYPKHLTFIGIHSFMDEELTFLETHSEIGVHLAHDVACLGVVAVAKDVHMQLQDMDAAYVTLDIDALDLAYAPGTGTPEAGGLSTRELLELLWGIFAEIHNICYYVGE